MVIRPVGPQPPSVYWVRRLLALVLVLVVVAVVWWLLPGGSDDTAPAADPAPASATSSTPSPTPSASPSKTKTKTQEPTTTPEAPPCDDADIEVSATTDARSYPPGESPTFTLEVANTSDVACLRDVGPAALELRVSSGGTKVWSSDDCSPGGSERLTVIEPGEPYVQTLVWGRQLSQEGCPTPLEAAPPGEYQLLGRDLEVLSQPEPFTLES